MISEIRATTSVLYFFDLSAGLVWVIKSLSATNQKLKSKKCNTEVVALISLIIFRYYMSIIQSVVS